MKIQFKHYWLLLLAGFLAFATLLWLEHRLAGHNDLQGSGAYEEVQRLVADKEVVFVKTATVLASDSVNAQRSWSTLADLAADEHIIIQVFRHDTLLAWSSNMIDMKPALKGLKEGISYLQGANGNYLVYQKNAGSYTYILLYNINTSYAFKNQYISNTFSPELSFIKEGFVLPKPVEGFTDIRDLTGDYLFSIQVFSSTHETDRSITVLLLLVMAYNLLLIHVIARRYIQHHLWATTTVFFLFFAFVRWVNIYEQVPAFLYKLKLFDPTVYASSLWFPSLGDLLIDSVICLWYLALLENRTGSAKERNHDGRWFWLKFALQCLLCLGCAQLAFSSVRSLTIDSQISFDISNVSSINLFTYVGIAICIIQLLCVYFLSRNFVRLLLRGHGGRMPMLVTSLALAGIYVWMSYRYLHAEMVLLLLAVCILLSFVLFKLFVTRLNRFQQYFVVVFIVSVFAAAAITHWLNLKERDNRKLFAGKLITQNDITTDYFLRNTERKLAEDRNISDYFLNPIIVKSQFEKRIRQLYFTGYLSKFEVSIFDYDTLGYHFKQRNTYSYSQINQAYEKQALETIDTYFRYIKSNADLKGYLAKFTVRRNGMRLGYLFVLLQPKLIQDENRFDELLIDGFRQNKKKLFDYSYAVYKDRNLIFQSGDYPYRITNTWGESRDTFRFFEEDHFDHLIYTDHQPLTIVVSRPSDSVLQSIALFSFIFTCCTLLLILILFSYIGINAHVFRRYRLLDNWLMRRIRTVFNRFMLIDNPDILYIRTRIQASIIFIVFITLAFTSYFTITFVTQKYNNRQTERLMKKLRNVVITIENENITEMNRGTAGELEAFINQIADVYDTDVTLYSPDGKVMASSIGKIYDEGIVSKLMNPNAFFHLNHLKESQFNQDERIASLDFQAAYAPVFRNKSVVLGYLQLPYFSQKADLLAEISSVIVGFINLYVLLFIIIGVIAYLVSRNISYPLMLIQQKLSHTVLGSKNEPISWQRDDEIGELVKQYNSMILQLEESAQKLAETEREGAWREIARQIAHEIKNPLTPMKLSIQHLHRAFKNNDSNLEDKINRTTNLLIAQIDTLSELATEFSSFAKMPAPNMEQLHVCSILDQLVELYSTNTDTVITLDCPGDPVLFFDRSYLGRSVGNLVKNAVQSIPEDSEGRVHIAVREDNESITISVKDNGSGIPDGQADKIFMPYFSTKISGMGLGLPIVKSMIESGGGHIGFETTAGGGTTFTITLPKNST